VRQLFKRKPIAELLVSELETPQSLKRVLGAGDLIMLAIGAVIGAGIFGAIGTAAAGQTDAAGHIVRAGAGPALVLSFLLLGVCCALAGLCYAELAAMIPQAGSAYAYSYATLGEVIAWIIGWDLILEYAVGNVAVAISWGDYFKSLLNAFGVHLPDFLTTGYRTALLSADPVIHGLLQSAPHVAGIPILINLPAFLIVGLITWLLLLGVRESARTNNVLVVIKLLVLALFIVAGLSHINAENYTPFAPNGWRGIHQGAAIVFFAYIGFDAISTAAEETKNPQRNLPIGILGGLAICTLIYVIVGAVLTGMVKYTELGVADPLAKALEVAGYKTVGWIVALGAIVSMSPCCSFSSTDSRGFSSRWRATACCRRGRRRSPPPGGFPTSPPSSRASSSRCGRRSAMRTRPTISRTSGRYSRSRWSRPACWCCATPTPPAHVRSACRGRTSWHRSRPRYVST